VTIYTPFYGVFSIVMSVMGVCLHSDFMLIENMPFPQPDRVGVSYTFDDRVTHSQDMLFIISTYSYVRKVCKKEWMKEQCLRMRPGLVNNHVSTVVPIEEFFRLWVSHKRQILSLQPTRMDAMSFDLTFSSCHRLFESLGARGVEEYRITLKSNDEALPLIEFEVVPDTGTDTELFVLMTVAPDQPCHTGESVRAMVSIAPLCENATVRISVATGGDSHGHFPDIMGRALFEAIPIFLNERFDRHISVEVDSSLHQRDWEYIPFLLDAIGKMGLEHLRAANITFGFVDSSLDATANEAVAKSRPVRCERLLALVMGLHQHLGVASPIWALGGVGDEIVKLIAKS
jgi:hypothetical protein